MKAKTIPAPPLSPKTKALFEGLARGLLAARPEETLAQARERFIRESEELEAKDEADESEV